MKIPDDVPHIQAECSHCGFLFDMKFGTDCPACKGVGVKWARLVTEQEAWTLLQNYGSEARTRLRTALDRAYPGSLCSPYVLTEGELKDIAELDRMFSMEDKRP